MVSFFSSTIAEGSSGPWLDDEEMISRIDDDLELERASTAADAEEEEGRSLVFQQTLRSRESSNLRRCEVRELRESDFFVEGLLSDVTSTISEIIEGHSLQYLSKQSIKWPTWPDTPS